MSLPGTHSQVLVPLSVRLERLRQTKILPARGLLFIVFLPIIIYPVAEADQTKRAFPATQPARLSKPVSSLARGDPRVAMKGRQNLLTSYVGPDKSRMALEHDRAAPLSLTSADFDEDGVPDLVAGYAFDDRGILTLHRGNVDSIYPNTPEARQRRASNTFTDAPFISPALVLETRHAADFLGAGDFDADGHWDIVVARRGGASLHFLSGDGKGNFGREVEIDVGGSVTAFAAGEINRRDGLTDLALGIDGPDGSGVLVLEGPLGAAKATPELLPMPSSVNSLAFGQLDEHYTLDLAVASGKTLVVVHGRDRKLTLAREDQLAIHSAHLSEVEFSSQLRSVMIGNFKGDSSFAIALLTEEGELQVLSQPRRTGRERESLELRTALSAAKTSASGSRTPVSAVMATDIDRWPLETVPPGNGPRLPV